MNLSGLAGWFSRYSRALQGAVALFILLGLLPTAWRWIARNFGSDLDVQVDWNPGTIPPGLSGWVGQVSGDLSILSEFETNPPKNQPFIAGLDGLIELSHSPIQKLLLGSPIAPDDGLLNIRIHNNSNEAISNVRLRVADFFPSWKVHLVGDFVTTTEAKGFYDKVETQSGASDVVLPDLPPLPPNGVMSVSLYGRGDFATVALSAPGRSYSVRNMTKIEDSTLVGIARHPFPAAWLATSILLFLAIPLWLWMVQSAAAKRFPVGLYDAACEEAKAGNVDSAMFLLRKAFEMGYSNKTHARGDPDLSSVCELAEFKSLVG